MTSKIKLSIIIVSHNTAELTLQALSSVAQALKEEGLDLTSEIIVVDNASSDGSQEVIKNFFIKSTIERKRWQLIENDRNVGFGVANNQAVEHAKGELILLLNSDTIVLRNSLSNLIDCYQKSSKEKLVNLLAAQLLNQDHSYQQQGGDLPGLMSLVGQWWFLSKLPIIGHYFPTIQRSLSYENQLQKIDTDPIIVSGWVGATALMISSSLFESLGGFDEQCFMYGEDLDLCWRAKKVDLLSGICTSAIIIHLGSQSSSSHFARKAEATSMLYFWNKHRGQQLLPLVRFVIGTGALIRSVVYLLLGEKKFQHSYFEIFKLMSKVN